jgi:hypothetical protein
MCCVACKFFSTLSAMKLVIWWTLAAGWILRSTADVPVGVLMSVHVSDLSYCCVYVSSRVHMPFSSPVLIYSHRSTTDFFTFSWT